VLALQLACGGWVAAAVAAAARLRLADLMAAGPRSAADLASATGTREPVLRRVLRVLVAVGLFAEQADGRFANTADSTSLQSDHPRSMRNFCMLAAGEYGQAFAELMHTLETGQPGFVKVFGGSVYEHFAARPKAADVYDRAMEELARPVGRTLATLPLFAGVRTVVDVGGGRGTLVKAVLQGHPHLRGICVDREDVCARAAGELRASDPALADRLSFVPGDFFASVPAGADVYLLKNVLHNWNDDSAVAILTRVREAMDAAGARLLVIEPLVGEGPPSAYEAMDDLLQMVICQEGTTARSADQVRTLLARAALAEASVARLPTGHSVVSAVLAA
jgi:C-methyltransferase